MPHIAGFTDPGIFIAKPLVINLFKNRERPPLNKAGHPDTGCECYANPADEDF
jgi:hypothetical protein